MNIFISGIGGSGAYYLAKYYSFLGHKIYGSDLEKNKNIEELLNNSAEIYIGEITSEFIQKIEKSFHIDMYIYSSALKEDHPERLFIKNKKVTQYEVGELTDLLIKNYTKNILSEKEKDSFLQSNIAPLFKIDLTKKKYIGITGTDGKTTTVNMIHHILEKLNLKVALISTIGCLIGKNFIETGLHTTTPSSQELFTILTDERMNEIEYVIIEVTSHGLAMGRIAGLKFDAVGITNITKEHLDYHKNRNSYFKSKSKIITEHLKNNGIVVLNKEDKTYKKLKKICDINKIQYEIITKEFLDKIVLKKEFDTKYNRLNGSIAYKIVSLLIKELNDYTVLSDFKGIKGRMEYLQKEPFSIIVDFAHTENALNVLLKELKGRLKNSGKLRVVFGCAGRRDKTKREKMGKIAASLAQAIYICPEDPRLESLQDINKKILKGIGINLNNNDFKKDYIEILNFNGKNIFLFQKFSVTARYEAIKKAIFDSQKDDIVVICGKGHEKSLCFGTKEYYWSDQEAVKDILSKIK